MVADGWTLGGGAPLAAVADRFPRFCGALVRAGSDFLAGWTFLRRQPGRVPLQTRRLLFFLSYSPLTLAYHRSHGENQEEGYV